MERSRRRDPRPIREVQSVRGHSIDEREHAIVAKFPMVESRLGERWRSDLRSEHPRHRFEPGRQGIVEDDLIARSRARDVDVHP
jgi:hypothetical protein